MPLLHLEQISHWYQGQRVLDHIDLQLAEGEILCLLGPSGSGKSTLLRLISGLEHPAQGRISCHGRDLAAIAAHQRQFGLMFQDYALFPHLSVFDNVAFGLVQQRMAAGAIGTRVTEMLHLVGLDGFERRDVTALSGGERQRVALARSLAPAPKLLMLDEPLGALDRGLRDHLAGELRTILKTIGVSSLLVTHDHEEAFSVADRVAILDQGQLLQVDRPEWLYTHPACLRTAAFLGFNNQLPARLDRHGRLVSALGSWKGHGLAAQGPGTLVIRPEGAQYMVDPDRRPCPLVINQAKVVRRQFQGRLYRLLLEATGLHLYFFLPASPPPPAEGQSITLALDPAALLFYPVEEIE